MKENPDGSQPQPWKDDSSHQYGINLFEGDGTTFDINLANDNGDDVWRNNICGGQNARKKMKILEQRRKKERMMQKGVATTQNVEAFDYVLVDAECSHDGSITHIEKYRTQWGMDSLEQRIPWLNNLEQLNDLQFRLLHFLRC